MNSLEIAFVRSLVELPTMAFGEIIESEDYSDERPRIYYRGVVYLELKQKTADHQRPAVKITN